MAMAWPAWFMAIESFCVGVAFITGIELKAAMASSSIRTVSTASDSLTARLA